MLETLLQSVFALKHVKAILTHFAEAVEGLQEEDWERAISRSGKFVEASLKALWLHTGRALPPARQFKAGNIIRDLKQLPIGTFDDAIRLTVPRACEFVYDIASNRGARHDPDEVDPNEMDATAVIAAISWILAELLRYSQKGNTSFGQTQDLIRGIIQRKYPVIEDVDGRIYFHIPGLSARQIAVLVLWHQHPNRMSTSALIAAIQRHGFSLANAKTAVARISNIVDVDAANLLRLLRPGIREAEELIKLATDG